MKTIKSQSENIYIVNKSKFISLAYPVSHEDECKEYLSEVSSKYSDATHICYAYILSTPRVEKCSDNGEPSGTAGRPMLEVLKKKNLENVLIVVVRYFGGKKLGAGGLIRAYTTSANSVIDTSEIVEYRPKFICNIVCDIKNGDKAKNIISRNNGNIIDIKYSDKVDITYEVESKEIEGEITRELWK